MKHHYRVALPIKVPDTQQKIKSEAQVEIMLLLEFFISTATTTTFSS
ncbi:hypothetical protein [Phocaeicola sp.]